ncbi:MAG: hypothetical protein IPP27_06470 [Bacteroidetes bacterium]|nr:hypothetical protein [Bacteroidota bacterium]MBK8365553.1 hypothetical protein [Bacteroidota bacterium]MBK9412256.1 hypothetical protein [Bacteroidota bacterium]MBL0031834.1 hypothetical protein [Bacteroidota bacterium]MBP6426853.1 hypothetical protein [Bacteroidia bacterium]
MKQRPRRIMLAILLIVTIGNYTRIIGDKDVRAVEVLSIFIMGVLSAILFVDILRTRKQKEKE